MPTLPSWEGQFFSSGRYASRVSVTRNGALQTALDVPDDVLLSVYWTGSHDLNSERATFRGTVEIRTLLASECTGAIGQPSSVRMEQAPLVIAVEEAEVVVNLPPRDSSPRVI